MSGADGSDESRHGPPYPLAPGWRPRRHPPRPEWKAPPATVASPTIRVLSSRYVELEVGRQAWLVDTRIVLGCRRGRLARPHRRLLRLSGTAEICDVRRTGDTFQRGCSLFRRRATFGNLGFYTEDADSRAALTRLEDALDDLEDPDALSRLRGATALAQSLAQASKICCDATLDGGTPSSSA